MAQIFISQNGKFSVRHRMECAAHNHRGPWRSSEREAYDDAEDHRDNVSAPHKMKVVTEQKMATEIQ